MIFAIAYIDQCKTFVILEHRGSAVVKCVHTSFNHSLTKFSQPDYIRCLPDSPKPVSPKLGFRVRVRVGVSANRDWTLHTQSYICSVYMLNGSSSSSNNNNNNTRTMFMVLSSCLNKHCESSPWFTRWVQRGARWPPTFGPSRLAWTICPPVGCQLTTLTIAILLLLSPKADIHFTIPRRIEGWVDLVGWLYRDGLQARTRSHIQVLTGPGVE